MAVPSYPGAEASPAIRAQWGIFLWPALRALPESHFRQLWGVHPASPRTKSTRSQPFRRGTCRWSEPAPCLSDGHFRGLCEPSFIFASGDPDKGAQDGNAVLSLQCPSKAFLVRPGGSLCRCRIRDKSLLKRSQLSTGSGSGAAADPEPSAKGIFVVGRVPVLRRAAPRRDFANRLRQRLAAPKRPSLAMTVPHQERFGRFSGLEFGRLPIKADPSVSDVPGSWPPGDELRAFGTRRAAAADWTEIAEPPRSSPDLPQVNPLSRSTGATRTGSSDRRIRGSEAFETA